MLHMCCVCCVTVVAAGERHGTPAERLLAAQRRANQAAQSRPHTLFATGPQQQPQHIPESQQNFGMQQQAAALPAAMAPMHGMMPPHMGAPPPWHMAGGMPPPAPPGYYPGVSGSAWCGGVVTGLQQTRLDSGSVGVVLTQAHSPCLIAPVRWVGESAERLSSVLQCRGRSATHQYLVCQ